MVAGGALVILTSVAATATVNGADSAAAGSSCERPYASWGPWNTPLVDPVFDRTADAKLARVRGPLTSDPTQYTYPVYPIAAGAAGRSVRVEGVFTDVRQSGRGSRTLRGTLVTVPIPGDARPAAGSDGQVVLVDRRTGDEWGFWRFDASADPLRATNGYHYNTRWSAVPPHDDMGRPFGSRGAGVPYLTGLVRPCEIARKRIDHALAFAYSWPSPEFVYPATKSDGLGRTGVDLPEGTRLALDPSVTPQQVRAWGCTGACFTIARALQRYGMYVIDNAGRAKLMMEYEGTARWQGVVTAKTVSPLPLSSFRVVENTTPRVRAIGAAGTAGQRIRLRYVAFDHGDATRETVVVQRGSRRVATLQRGFHASGRGSSFVEWRTRGRRPSSYTFCVTSRDPAGHASAAACAAVRLR